MGYYFRVPDASGNVAPDFCQFLANFDWSRGKIREFSDLIRADVARHVISALAIVDGTEADTSDTRTLLRRYIDHFKISRPNIGDEWCALLDWQRAETSILNQLGRTPTRSEVGVMLVSVLRLCEGELFTDGAR